MNHWTDSLKRYAPCGEALAWLKTQPDAETAWNACERGDWMLWIAAEVGVDRKLIVLAACDCAASVPQGKAGKHAIATARKWARGKATIVEVRTASDAAAYAAAYAAYAAAYAAYAATYAATDAAAYAAAYAAYAASYAAAYAATDAATDAAYASKLSECASIARKRISYKEVAKCTTH